MTARGTKPSPDDRYRDGSPLPYDTCREEDRFFSYRRATLRGEPDYGRNLSAIALEA